MKKLFTLKVFKISCLSIAMGLSVMGPALAQKGGGNNPAANLDQVRNGKFDNPISPADWVNGNAGASNAHYVESHSIPYRAILTNLPPNTHVELIIGYDVLHSSKNAIDFLTHYDRLQPHGQFQVGGNHPAQEIIDPTIGTQFRINNGADPMAPTATYPIPRPAVNTPPPLPTNDVPGIVYDAIILEEGVGKVEMSMWGATFENINTAPPSPIPATAIAYVGIADLQAAQSEQQIKIAFLTPAGNPGSKHTVMLAWGGHIANRNDWSPTGATVLSAGGISGSPYHMRLISWNQGGLGNQDRSLSAAAVIAPPDCDITGYDDVCVGSVVTYTGPTGADSYAWTIEPLTNTSGAFFTGNNTEAITINGPTNTVTVNSGPDGGGYTIKLVTTKDGIPSGGDCDLDVTVYKVETPKFTIQDASLCGSATASITICDPIVGVTYKVTQDAGGAAEQSTTYVSGTLSFSGLVPGKNVYVEASVTVDGGATCSATPADCDDKVASCTPDPPVRQAAPTKPQSSIGKAESKDLIAYPVPFSENVTVEFKATKAENYVINLYDLQGHLVRELKAGNAKAGEVIKVEVSGAGMAESMYLVRKVSKSGISTVKLLKKD